MSQVDQIRRAFERDDVSHIVDRVLYKKTMMIMIMYRFLKGCEGADRVYFFVLDDEEGHALLLEGDVLKRLPEEMTCMTPEQVKEGRIA